MKFVFIAAIIALLVFGSQHFLTTSTDANACTDEPLPYCAQLDRLGSHFKVTNNCEFEISVQWRFLAGNDQLHDLAPGNSKQLSSYPVKIESVTCCPEMNRCW